MWLRSEINHADAERARLREAWVLYHKHLAHTFNSLAEDHERQARQLEAAGTAPAGGWG